MIIDHVRIVNCNRFALGGRKDITLKPKSKIQMILGTNGSGKSSFVELCFSPLSPSPNDFDDGGYWEFKCTDKGSTYFLSADYDKKKYQFFKDGGENLNPGGTITVQDALVEQHLGYTRYIHNLLILQNRLTQMNPRERGDVISNISREDLSFAYSKFREWTKEYNSSRSVQRFLLGRIAEEETKLMPDEDKVQITENIKKIKLELRELLSLDRPHYDDSVTMEMVKSLKDSFISSADKFLRLDPPVTKFTDSDSMQSYIDALTGKYELLSDELKKLSSEVSRVESRKNELEKLSTTNIDEINDEITKLEEYMSQIPESTIDIPEELMKPADHLIATLINRLGCLHDNPEEADLDYREALNESNKITEAINKGEYEIANISSRIDEMISVNEIQCPNCQSVFKPGVNEEELSKLQERLLRGRQYVFELDKKGRTIMDQLSLLESHRDAMDDLYKLRDQHYNQNVGLFMYIDSLGGFRKGKGLISFLSIYSREVTNSTRRARILDRLKVLKTVLNEHAGKNLEIVEIKQEFNRLDSIYNEKFEDLRKISELKDMEVNTKNKLGKYAKAYDEVLVFYDKLSASVKHMLIKEYLIMVDVEISRRQSTLALNESALSNNELIETLIKDLKIQLDKTNLDVEAYKSMVDAINPRTGLIAERMYAQIGSKIEGINTIISKVWNYDFTVKMPDITSGRLDYRFPILSAGTERSDISKGSGSMRDIVDTAFAILVHHSLKLDGFPIYLDEFDSPFDGVHTSNMVSMVKDLADSGRYGHVVVISHDENIQAAFPDAEVLVLDDRNLDSNKTVNTHVTFN